MANRGSCRSTHVYHTDAVLFVNRRKRLLVEDGIMRSRSDEFLDVGVKGLKMDLSFLQEVRRKVLISYNQIIYSVLAAEFPDLCGISCVIGSEKVESPLLDHLPISDIPGVRKLVRDESLAAAKGEQFAFRAHVLKPGRTLTVCDARAFAFDRNPMERLVATMTGTLMAVYDREGVRQ